MRILTGGAVAVVMAEAMKAMSWSMPEIVPEPRPLSQGKKPTGAANAKRAAQKRRNIRARSKK